MRPSAAGGPRTRLASPVQRLIEQCQRAGVAEAVADRAVDLDDLPGVRDGLVGAVQLDCDRPRVL
jgi:hypothetical protein